MDDKSAKVLEASLKSTIRVRTGARKAKSYVYTAEVTWLKVDADGQTVTIVAREPAEKEKGIDLIVTMPFETLMQLGVIMAARMKK